MDTLKKNIESLKSYRPRLFELIKSFLDSDQVSVEGNNLKFVQDGSFLYDLPFAEDFNRSAQQSPLEFPRILVIDGVGLGFHVVELEKQMPSSVRHAVVVEKDPEIFVSALKCFDMSSLFASPQWEFFVGVGQESMVPVLRDYFVENERLIYTDRIEHFFFLPSLKRDGVYYQSFAESMQKAVEEHRAMYLSTGEDNMRGFINVVSSYGQKDYGLTTDVLKGAGKGFCGAVLSAGPSLEEHLTPLNKYQDNMILVATDGALKTVLAAGITPHLVVTIERVKAGMLLLGDLPRDFNTPLVAQPVVYPEVLQDYPGPVFMCPRQASFGTWLYPGSESLYVGSNVATMAYRLLCYMECSQIYLLGQDLAYDRKSRSSHTKGINPIVKEFTEKFSQSDHACEIEGNNGEPIASMTYWKMFRDDFDFLISQMGVETSNVIDVHKGAKIFQAKHLDPKEFWQQVVPKMKPFQPEQILRLCQSSGQNCDFERTVKETVVYLDCVLQESLKLAHEVSVTFHEKRPLYGDDEEVTFYGEVFEKWQKSLKRILFKDEALFSNFLYCFFGSDYVRLMSRCESLNPKEGMGYILGYVSAFQDMLMYLGYWCQRVRFELLREGS